MAAESTTAAPPAPPAGVVRAISSADEYESFVTANEAAGRTSAVFFWAAFHEPSKAGGQMDAVWTQLASMHASDMAFAKVEAEECADVAVRFDVAVVPTFVFVRAGKVLRRVEGASPPDVAKAVAAVRSAGTSAGAGATPAAAAAGTSAAGATKGTAGASSGSGSSGKPSAAGAEEVVLSDALAARLKKLVRTSHVMLFMKGTPDAPRCGFSRRMVELLRSEHVTFGAFDILGDNEVRQGLKKFANWPTYPQLWVAGELKGGLDIAKAIRDEEGSLASLCPPADKAIPLDDRLRALVSRSETMLFMKGTPDEPRCGFSRRCVALLRDNKVGFDSFDILSDEDVRQGLKTLFDWPTYPQLYVKGKLVGGLDLLKEMAEEGGLAAQLGVPEVESLDDRMRRIVSEKPVMLMMKGDRAAPRCGFSRQAVALLEEEGFEYGTFDILGDEDVRQGLKKLFNWPTYPQLYVDGKLVGGLDVLKQMKEEGELGDLKPKTEAA